MTDQQKTNEIISLLTFLQIHIQNYASQSFTDLAFDLENIIRDYVNVFENPNAQYENINSIKHNYPAIDLVNKTKSVALQVTVNGNLQKVRETLDTYQKHNISYSELIVIGFVKATKSTIPGVTVHGIEYLIGLARFGTVIQKDSILEILQRQIPLNSLNPIDDKLCFDVVFDIINRSAVRDYTICEGDFDKMVMGLSEIKEIITTGKIKGKSIRAKCLTEYTSEIKNQLSEIEFNVSEILQICNLNKNRAKNNFLCLTNRETEEIDELKEQIINKTNELSRKFLLTKKIVGSRRR